MKKKGWGLSAACHPTGVAGGTDFSQAYVKIKPDGTADLIVGAVDVGQGCKTVLAQMAADELGLGYDQINVINHDTDICPISLGTFASRVTYFDGKAVMAAARDARSMLFEAVAADLGESPENLIAADGNISVVNDPERSVSIAAAALKASFAQSKPIIGRGYYRRQNVPPDPETGASDTFATMAWAATLAEVEVDLETGEVEVLKIINAYDVGKAINPMLIEGQVEGGTVMALGEALMEQLYPAYPSLEWQPDTLRDYIIPTTLDLPDLQIELLEVASTEGPHGAKGLGEMTANIASPAIISAIYDAVGVWINDLPATPEKVLRALEERQA
ncbi:MAG: molybdopterin cofactor-binding domain-containing protein [Pseudomonadota bacterium]